MVYVNSDSYLERIYGGDVRKMVDSRPLFPHGDMNKQ